MAKYKYIPRPGKEHFRYVGIDPCPCGDGQVLNVTIGEMTQEQMEAWFEHSPKFSRRYIAKVQDNEPDAPPPQAPEEEKSGSEALKTTKKRKTKKSKKSEDE